MVLGSALGPGISGWLIDKNVGIEIQLLAYAGVFAICAVLLGLAARMVRRLSATA